VLGASHRRALSALAGVLLLTVAASPAGASSIPQPPSTSQTVLGIGATFPYPAYSSWFSRYRNAFSGAHVSFQYKANGSGAGIKAVQGNPPTADWGASDLPMTDTDLGAVANNNGPILDVPTLLGAVVLGINLNCSNTKSITLSRQNVGDIFAGIIKNWNDSRLRDNGRNPGLASCNVSISPVHRSDSSGTTANFTAFLDKCSDTYWAGKLSGPTKQYGAWPVGIAGKGNSQVALRVKQVNGRIGYMEYAYARQAGLKIARVQNGDGNNYVTASTSSVQAAAKATLNDELSAHPDLRFDPVACASGFNSYPITAYSHALLFTNEPTSLDHGEAIVSFFYWGLTKGQSYLSGLGYASLPTAVATKSIAQLHKVLWNGSAIWP